MNEFSVRKLSKVVDGDEEVVSKYRMLRLHSGTDRPFNLFAGGDEVEAVIDATIISAQPGRDYPPWIHAPAKTKAVGEFLASPLYSLTGSLDAEEGCPFSLSLHLVLSGSHRCCASRFCCRT